MGSCSSILPLFLFLIGAVFPAQAQSKEQQDLPTLVTIRMFMSGARNWGEGTQVRLRGTVTDSISDKTFFIQDGDVAVYVFHKPPLPFRVGELVEVIGKPSLGGLTPSLQNCTVTSLGKGRVPAPIEISADRTIDTTLNSRLVTLKGRLGPERLVEGRTFLIRPAGASRAVAVDLEALPDRRGLSSIQSGSLLDVTGVLIIQGSAGKPPEAGRIHIRDTSDIVVLSGPPFWSEGLIRQLLVGTAIGLSLAAGWIWVLRRQVAGQTRVIQARLDRELALREAEERFAKAFAASPDVCTIVRQRDEVLIDLNPAFEKLAGRSREEMLGQPVSMFQLWADPHARAEAVRQLQSQGSLRNFKFDVHSKTGDKHHYLLSVQTTDLNGEPCWYSVARDVTEQIKAEEERARLQAQLQQAKRMESLGTLAGGIAHDFNNLIGAILGNAELAKQDSLQQPGVQESLDEILKASFRARDLVNQILVFSRNQNQKREVVELQDIIENAASLLRSIIPASIQIRRAIQPGTPAVVANPGQIHQVVMNLGTNAWHAMEEHPGTLTISLHPLELAPGHKVLAPGMRSGPYACISVSDEGEGFDDVTRERIFDPFFTTKGPGKGTGLGLAVVHGIILDHGGAVVVNSTKGRGSEFSIYLPASGQAAAPESILKTEPGLPKGNKEQILVVDDHLSLLQIMAKVLERNNYRVTPFSDPFTALDSVGKCLCNSDLVITDLNMPGKDGLQFATELHQLKPETPIILASGFITEELRTKARQAGIVTVLQKPVTTDQLLLAVHEILSPRGGSRHSS